MRNVLLQAPRFGTRAGLALAAVVAVAGMGVSAAQKAAPLHTAPKGSPVADAMQRGDTQAVQ